MSPRYLLYTPSNDIADHILLFQRLGNTPFVWEVKHHPRSKYRIITVCAQDRHGLFSKVSGVFTLNNLDILNAQIYTWENNIALDIFTVKAPVDSIREKEIWTRAENNLLAALEGTLDLTKSLSEKFSNRRVNGFKAKERSPKVVVDNTSSNFFTVIEVYAYNYPGLLYRITDTLFRCELDVRVAKIGTEVDQVLDVFYVRDFQGQKVAEPDQEAAIQNALLPILSDNRE